MFSRVLWCTWGMLTQVITTPISKIVSQVSGFSSMTLLLEILVLMTCLRNALEDNMEAMKQSKK